MKKTQLKDLVAECLQEHLAERASKKKLGENKIKRSALKGLVKEVIKQCMKESNTGSKEAAGPQYKVQTAEPQLETPGLKMRVREVPSNPEIREGYKVQASSTKTVKDLPQKPELERDPKKTAA